MDYEEYVQERQILKAWRKRLEISFKKINNNFKSGFQSLKQLSQLVVDQKWDNILTFFDKTEDTSSYFVAVILTKN